MGLFEKKRDKLLKEIAQAKKQKEIFKKQAIIKDREINKKIAQKEELEQLKFNLARLKKKPISKAQAIQKQKLINNTKRIAGKLGRGFLGGLAGVIQSVGDQEPIKRKTTIKKKVKKKR